MLEVLAVLLGLLISAGKKQEHKEAQREADKVEDDPAGWFADHFRVQSGVTGDAQRKASEADPDSSYRG